MWDLLRIRKKLDECGRLRDALESAADTPALSRAQQEHLAACPQCQVVADDIVMSRALLREVPARGCCVSPWRGAGGGAGLSVRASPGERCQSSAQRTGAARPEGAGAHERAIADTAAGAAIRCHSDAASRRN